VVVALYFVDINIFETQIFSFFLICFYFTIGLGTDYKSALSGFVSKFSRFCALQIEIENIIINISLVFILLNFFLEYF